MRQSLFLLLNFVIYFFNVTKIKEVYCPHNTAFAVKYSATKHPSGSIWPPIGPYSDIRPCSGCFVGAFGLLPVR